MANEHYLVVDLDGTLIRSDMLFESFWSAVSQRWTAPFGAAQALMGGRAALKQRLSQEGAVDVTSLPYNPAVLEFIAKWRADGGRTALVTATNQDIARQVADHLGVFDEVHGSDAVTNLKGARKASFLEGRYGAQGFDYIGDAGADIPVWEKASRAIMVNVPAAVRSKIEILGREIVDLPVQITHAKSYLKTMRPHQWLKNLLVFLPLLAAHVMDAALFGQALLAFFAFSLVASSVYVLNDMLDLSADRAHPRKRNRPFASGAVPLAHGTWIAPALLVGGFALSIPLGVEFMVVIAGYYVATLAYSLYFKRQLIVDICMLAGLYAIRIVAGGAATGIDLSLWLIAFSLAIFFALAAVKRQAELVDSLASGREKVHGRGYRTADLPLVTAMATAAGYLAVLVLSLYITSPDVLQLYANPNLLWGTCLVLFYWINRIVMLTHRGEMHDDPVIFAATDRASLVCFALIFAIGVGASL